MWYIGPGTRMVCGVGVGVQAARKGNDDSGVQTPCAKVRITLGSPVDPLLHIPLAWGDTTSGRASVDSPAARAASTARVSSSIATVGAITSSTRDRSQPGRSQRIGTGTAPIFQHPRTASTNSSELGIPSATSEPTWAPAADKARPHWLARPSSSANVSDCAFPSRAITVRATSSPRCSASCRSLAPNGIPCSSAVVTPRPGRRTMSRVRRCERPGAGVSRAPRC